MFQSQEIYDSWFKFLETLYFIEGRAQQKLIVSNDNNGLVFFLINLLLGFACTVLLRLNYIFSSTQRENWNYSTHLCANIPCVCTRVFPDILLTIMVEPNWLMMVSIAVFTGRLPGSQFCCLNLPAFLASAPYHFAHPRTWTWLHNDLCVKVARIVPSVCCSAYHACRQNLADIMVTMLIQMLRWAWSR